MIETGSVVIVSGVPGAGKTTVARALAGRLPRSAHIERDLIAHHLIVSGLVPPQGPPQDEAERQLRLSRRNIVLLAASFTDDGFVAVIHDVVISPGDADQGPVAPYGFYIAKLKARPIRFVQLTPSVGIVRARDAGRHKQVFEIWGHLDAELRAWPEPRPGLWLDTSTMSAEDTVDAILARADEAIVAP